MSGLADTLWWCQGGSSKVTRSSDSWALHHLPRIRLTLQVKMLSETCHQEGLGWGGGCSRCLRPWLSCRVAWPSQSVEEEGCLLPRKLPPRIPLKWWLVSVLNLSFDVLVGYSGAGHPAPPCGFLLPPGFLPQSPDLGPPKALAPDSPRFHHSWGCHSRGPHVHVDKPPA